MPRSWKDWVKTVLVVFAFFAVLCFGALKSLIVGPIASLILISGNLGVILGLFPAHVAWTVYTLLKTDRFDAPLKVAVLLGLPALFGIWLGLSIAVSVLVGLGYGFFTPWISSFEAFRLDDDESKKCVHCILDGTWETIKGSCTVVQDFADGIDTDPLKTTCPICEQFNTYKECIRPRYIVRSTFDRFIHVPACIIVGLLGLIVEIPLYTAIAIVKSPFMLFKGWHRLLHDLISREGPFLETACIPIAGLTIIMWPIVVIGSIIMAIFSSFFIGLYGSVIVYQERSFRRGIAYVIAMVAEFDEYTNDWLYLREGSILPKPRYRKKKMSNEFSVGRNHSLRGSVLTETPAILVPSLTSSRSVREAIKEVKMVQVWGSMMRSCEGMGKELLDKGVLTSADLSEWLKAKHSHEAHIIGVGLPCFALLHTLLYSIKNGSNGLMFTDNTEVNYHNRPQDRLLDWFFHPVMVLKEQIRVINLEEGEIQYLEKLILFGNNEQRYKSWENGSIVPKNSIRAAQIEGLSRRMLGIIRSSAKLPTYRRRFRQVVKALVAFALAKEGGGSKAVDYSGSKGGSNRSLSSAAAKEGSNRSMSTGSIASLDIV